MGVQVDETGDQGMARQLLVSAGARNVAGLEGANSTECEPNCAVPVIDLMDDQRNVAAKGGTMRLGAYPCTLETGSNAWDAYGTGSISERHRHRWEFNNAYRETLQAAGLRLSGLSPDGKLVEVIEIADHPYFLGCQFHPEFKSRPLKPHPLFVRFIKASAVQANTRRRARPHTGAVEAIVN